jgi:TNFR/NGFR cysteine-rich region
MIIYFILYFSFLGDAFGDVLVLSQLNSMQSYDTISGQQTTLMQYPDNDLVNIASSKAGGPLLVALKSGIFQMFFAGTGFPVYTQNTVIFLNGLRSDTVLVAVSPDFTLAVASDMSGSSYPRLYTSALSTSGSGIFNAYFSQLAGLWSTDLNSAPVDLWIHPSNLFCLGVNRAFSTIIKYTFSNQTSVVLAGKANSTGFMNGIGTVARFSNPNGIDISQDSSYAWITDYGNNQVRKLVISTANVTSICSVNKAWLLRFQSDYMIAWVVSRDGILYGISVPSGSILSTLTLDTSAPYTSLSIYLATTPCIPGSTYSTSGTTPCIPCGACGDNTYRSGTCTITRKTVCTDCTTCGNGKFMISACSYYLDTVCRNCTVCGAGQYASSACTGTTDTVCPNCLVCGAGQYASSVCTTSSNTVCPTCTVCGTGNYTSSACSATSDTVCGVCPSNSYCPNGVVSRACPGTSISPQGSSSFLNCSCPAGTSGTVTAQTASCSQCSPGSFCSGLSCQC